MAADRLRLTETGQVVLARRQRWRDGTTHLLFDPIELLERLAALTPRPRVNLVLYYGVLAGPASMQVAMLVVLVTMRLRSRLLGAAVVVILFALYTAVLFSVGTILLVRSVVLTIAAHLLPSRCQ